HQELFGGRNVTKITSLAIIESKISNPLKSCYSTHFELIVKLGILIRMRALSLSLKL
ncbi:hypothetical protein BOH78_5025, partial [Pichia kudriavzevii]